MTWQDAVAAVPVLMVLRCDETEQARSMALTAIDAGATAIELTLTTPGGVALVEELAATAPQDVAIGAGTVLSGAQARDVVAAGAEFLVAPDFDRDVLAVARDAGVGYVPGAFTPTEVLAATKAGAEHVKLFPASSHAPSYLRALTAVSPGLRLYPSGGVDASNAGDWLAAGAAAVCVSSALNSAVAQGGPDGLHALVARLVHDHSTTPSVMEPR